MSEQPEGNLESDYYVVAVVNQRGERWFEPPYTPTAVGFDIDFAEKCVRHHRERGRRATVIGIPS